MAWKRIILVIFVLIGGVIFFRYWSINQFNQAFDDLSAFSYVAIVNTPSFFSDKTKKEQTPTTTPEIISTPATSTDETIILSAGTSADLELSFTFPQKNDEVYIGCAYQLSWQSSTTISLLKTALVDAGTRESMGPIASGLAKENAIEKDSQNLSWKVGVVWPGEYYIKVSNINGVDLETRSKVFTISKIPEGISADEKEKICKESNSSF